MAIYIGVAVLLFCFSLSKKKILAFFSFVILVILACLRGNEVGFDVVSYAESFEWHTYLLGDSYEIGWSLLCFFIDSLGGDFRSLLFVSALLALFPLFVFFKKSSADINKSFLIYYCLCFYFICFNQMRQAIALSFFCLAWHFYFNRQRMKCYSFFILSVLFHYSALFFLALFLLYPLIKKIELNVWVKLSIISLVIGPFIYPFITSVISVIGVEKYANYANYGSHLDFNIVGVLSFNILRTVIYVFIIKNYGKIESSPYISLTFCGIVFSNLFNYLIGVDRLVWYLTFMDTITFPYCLQRYISLKNGKINSIVFVSFIFFTLIWGLLHNSQGVVPYIIFD